ncbi:hypothetical protein ElyMa_001252300 [Elysia marginata]|uniref:Mutator-like transposase domain-containing protein n=1 Tax=Elysia marginata TaxID=1093978 RepID=A0AAV4IDG5_9GAST|nr:hypothetical protein ElyMa_001252300 [Elysia marginata]
MTRGHSSLIGIGCIIDTLTGLVLDAHVLSQHCQTCATSGEWVKRETPHRYEQWLAQNPQEGCSVNYKGSSEMMEPEAAEVMWKRSLELHNIRYTTFVGDGDSKAHDRVVRQKPYGEDVEIRKEECMNHVEKRMGTALRNLVQDCKKRGIL